MAIFNSFLYLCQAGYSHFLGAKYGRKMCRDLTNKRVQMGGGSDPKSPCLMCTHLGIKGE